MPGFSGLNELIKNDSQARTYFQGLPQHVRDGISAREQNINSFDSLKDYAENLLRGDQ